MTPVSDKLIVAICVFANAEMSPITKLRLRYEPINYFKRITINSSSVDIQHQQLRCAGEYINLA